MSYQNGGDCGCTGAVNSPLLSGGRRHRSKSKKVKKSKSKSKCKTKSCKGGRKTYLTNKMMKRAIGGDIGNIQSQMDQVDSQRTQSDAMTTNLGNRFNKTTGGGSDWINSQYAAGPVNSPAPSTEIFRMFNKTSDAPGYEPLTSPKIDAIMSAKNASGYGDDIDFTTPSQLSSKQYASVGGKRKRRSKKSKKSKKGGKRSKKTRKSKRSKHSKKSAKRSGGKRHRKLKKSKKSKKSKSRKGGNILGELGAIIAPAGLSATTATLGLLGLNQLVKGKITKKGSKSTVGKRRSRTKSRARRSRRSMKKDYK